MKNAVIIFLFLVVSELLQHITHEAFHIVVGKLSGLSFVSVQWFTYHGGSKVTFKDEEEVLKNSDAYVPKKWIIMNLAPFVGTTILAYIFVMIYCFLPAGSYIKLFFFILSGCFLIMDSGYTVLCAFSKSGDLYLVSKYFKNSIFIKIIPTFMFILNLIVFISIR